MFLAGHSVAMVTYYATKMITCSPMVGQSFYTMIVALKDDFQSVLHCLRTLMFVNIINGSLDGMRIDVIR